MWLRQQILGEVRDVIYYFVANLTDFLAVKEFRKSVKISRNYRHDRVALNARHGVCWDRPRGDMQICR